MDLWKPGFRFIISNLYPPLKPFVRLFSRSSQGVKVAIFYKGKLLLIRNTYRKGWTLPGGGVKKDESPEQAAIRELREEVGISIPKLNSHGTIKLDFERNSFVTVFSGRVNSIDFQIDGLEIDEAKWVDTKELSKMDILPVASRCFKLLKLK